MISSLCRFSISVVFILSTYGCTEEKLNKSSTSLNEPIAQASSEPVINEAILPLNEQHIETVDCMTQDNNDLFSEEDPYELATYDNLKSILPNSSDEKLLELSESLHQKEAAFVTDVINILKSGRNSGSEHGNAIIEHGTESQPELSVGLTMLTIILKQTCGVADQMDTLFQIHDKLGGQGIDDLETYLKRGMIPQIESLISQLDCGSYL